MNTAQLIFDLEPRSAFQADDFLVADCNRAAVDWLDKFPDWPAPALVVTGGKASGKSHLVSVFLEAQNAHLGTLDPKQSSEIMFGEYQALVLENIDQQLFDSGNQEALFHLFNHAKETDRFLLMTSQTPPARWPLSLNDLTSRLNACPIAEISAPDDQLLGALIVKHFADRQIRVDPGVVSYAVTRIERTFAAALDFVVACDRLSLTERKAVTVPLARQVLSHQLT